MGRQTLSPETFGEHATKWGATFFEIRISNETKPERINEAIKAEAARSEPREWRIACCNKRLSEL